MIKLIAHNEQEDGFETEVHIEGEGYIVAQQLTAIFDRIYEGSPKLLKLLCLYVSTQKIIRDII